MAQITNVPAAYGTYHMACVMAHSTAYGTCDVMAHITGVMAHYHRLMAHITNHMCHKLGFIMVMAHHHM